jgi:hypothetical protein
MQAVVVRNLFVAAMVLLLTPLVVSFVVAAALAGRPNAPAAIGDTLSTILRANFGCLSLMIAGAACLVVAIVVNRTNQA